MVSGLEFSQISIDFIFNHRNKYISNNTFRNNKEIIIIIMIIRVPFLRVPPEGVKRWMVARVYFFHRVLGFRA